MLLYGLTFSRIQQLRRDEVEQRSAGIYLALDRRDGHRLRPAEPVGDLLAGHPASAAAARSDWMFPGTMPGQPVSEDCASGFAGLDSRTSAEPAPPH